MKRSTWIETSSCQRHFSRFSFESVSISTPSGRQRKSRFDTPFPLHGGGHLCLRPPERFVRRHEANTRHAERRLGAVWDFTLRRMFGRVPFGAFECLNLTITAATVCSFKQRQSQPRSCVFKQRATCAVAWSGAKHFLFIYFFKFLCKCRLYIWALVNSDFQIFFFEIFIFFFYYSKIFKFRPFIWITRWFRDFKNLFFFLLNFN